MDGWTQQIVGSGLGTLGAIAVAAVAWLLNQRRLRKSIGLVLYFDVKAVRQDWIQAVREGAAVSSNARLQAWRGLQHTAAGLFPRILVGRLTELSWFIDWTLSGRHRYNMGLVDGEWTGLDDTWALAARAERDLARYADEPFDAATEERLRRYEARFGSGP